MNVSTNEIATYVYTNHCEFFSAKKNSSETSYYDIVNKLGNISRTQIKKMFLGKVSMSKKILFELCDYFGLNEQEKNYLNFCRQFQEAKDPEIAIGLYSKIAEIRKKYLESSSLELDEIQLKVYEKWFILPILYYFDLENSSTNIKEIQKHFHGDISIEEIESAINILKDLELIEINQDGKVKKSVRSTTIPDGIPRPLVKKFHFEMIKLSGKAVYEVPQEKRFLMGLTIPMDADKLPLIKERVSKFVLQLNEEFSSENATVLKQMNIQLFSLAECKD